MTKRLRTAFGSPALATCGLALFVGAASYAWAQATPTVVAGVSAAPGTNTGVLADATRWFVNLCGAHPSFTAVVILCLVVGMPLLIIDLRCSAKLAGLKAAYPDRDKRPPEIAAQMARLDFIVRWFSRRYKDAQRIPVVGGRLPDGLFPDPPEMSAAPGTLGLIDRDTGAPRTDTEPTGGPNGGR